jgi:hypothetical protein
MVLSRRRRILEKMIIESCDGGYKIDRQAEGNEKKKRNRFSAKKRELIVHRSCHNKLLIQQEGERGNRQRVPIVKY